MSAAVRLAVVSAALLACALLAAAPAGARVKAPKRGPYLGETHTKKEITLHVKGRSITKAVVDFKCHFATGRATLRRVHLKRTRRGFKFALKRRRTVTYNDHHTAEKATIAFSGRFSRAGTKVHGRLSARSLHCGAGKRTAWSARYVKHPPKLPSGQYSGRTDQGAKLDLFTSGRSIDLASMEFKCGDATARTNLSAIPLRRTLDGYTFSIRAKAGVSYDDGHPDDNGTITLSGRFTRTAKRAGGHVRLKSPHCGGTGELGWAVSRVRGS